MNHGKEVGGELVVGCGDTAKVLQSGEEALAAGLEPSDFVPWPRTDVSITPRDVSFEEKNRRTVLRMIQTGS